MNVEVDYEIFTFNTGNGIKFVSIFGILNENNYPSKAKISVPENPCLI